MMRCLPNKLGDSSMINLGRDIIKHGAIWRIKDGKSVNIWGDSQKVHWVRWEELCKPKEQGGMGIKDLSRFNDALLTKQTWQLLHDKSTLFYPIFKERFFPHCSIMEATCPSLASYAWKSIIKGRDIIKRGAIWRIGDGKSVNIWGDRWLSLKYSPIILSPRVGGLVEAKVHSFIDELRTQVLEGSIDR